jgi:tetratricopeptide (TPR) repeat protein
MVEMAQLAAERLNRNEDAARLYREILDEDPSRVDVLDALEKHAERTRDWATLADALERRVALQDDEKDRLNVLQKLGAVYAEHLSDGAAAARTWRRVLELQPGHHRALRVLRDACLESGDFSGLEALYASQGDFEGLADVLSNAADRAKDASTKIDLSYRAAAVYEERLGVPDRAFRSYERILATDPTDARAARALIPLYERDEKWARLPALYEVLLNRVTEPEEQLSLLEKLVEVTGGRLGDRRAAVGYARRAYEVAPASALELLESTVRAAGAWDVLVECIQRRLDQGGTIPPPAAAAPAGEEASEGSARPKRRRRRRKGESDEGVDAGEPEAAEEAAPEAAAARSGPDREGASAPAPAPGRGQRRAAGADGRGRAELPAAPRARTHRRGRGRGAREDPAGGGDRRDDLRGCSTCG